MFTKADVMKAVEGAHTNATEEATSNVCARISAWLMERSQSARGDNEDRADALEEAALDLRDGEWRRAPRCTLCGASRILDDRGRAGACSLVPGRDGKGGCRDPLHDVRAAERRPTSPSRGSGE